MPPPLRIAALTSIYQRWSHADVIFRHILDGYPPDGKERPNLQIVSMYVDQISTEAPRPDLSRGLAEKHGFKLCGSVEEALTLGGKKLAVDGVISVFEHGEYPRNRYGQTMYPRRKIFEQITRVFEEAGQAVPVFSDKHLSVKWDECVWMVERARKLMVPFMAGSSIPGTHRDPSVELPRNCEIEAAVSIGYGHLEHYGFHAIEGMQCMVERRKLAVAKPGEAPQQGVKAVTTHMGPEIWAKIDADPRVKRTFEAALSQVKSHAKGEVREVARRDSGLIEIEYRDGLRAYIVMISGWIGEGDGGAFTFAAQLKGVPEPISTLFYLDNRTETFPHFMLLMKAIDAMLRSGHAVSPVERTLLTSGITEMVMRSRARYGERIETPHLDVSYRPSEWPHGGEVPDWLKAARKN